MILLTPALSPKAEVWVEVWEAWEAWAAVWVEWEEWEEAWGAWEEAIHREWVVEAKTHAISEQIVISGRRGSAHTITTYHSIRIWEWEEEAWALVVWGLEVWEAWEEWAA